MREEVVSQTIDVEPRRINSLGLVCKKSGKSSVSDMYAIRFIRQEQYMKTSPVGVDVA